MPVGVSCSWCGEPKFLKPSHAKRIENPCCNRICKAMWQSAVRLCDDFDITLSNYVNCSHCGKEFYKKTYSIKRSENHFCCLEHKNKWMEEFAPRGEDHPKYSKVEIECSNCQEKILKRSCDLERCENLFCNLKCHGEWQSTYRTGINSPTYNGGKVKTLCGNPECGKNVLVFPYKLRMNINNFCDLDCRNTWQKYRMTGEGSPAWNNGASFEEYPKDFSKGLKGVIRERDEFICQECGYLEEDEKLSIHHIDYNKQNSSFYNLISLCRRCHGYTNFNREYWKQYFKDKIKIKYRNKEIHYG